jgi:hypothetical protein
MWSQGVTFRKDTVFTRMEEYFMELTQDYFSRNTPFHPGQATSQTFFPASATKPAKRLRRH